jgi:hypothetical protein
MDANERWQALADLLRHQRVVVLGHRSRAAFAREKGVSDRVLFDLESAKKGSYSENTLLSLEVWYELKPEQLRDVLGPLYPGAEVVTRVGNVTISSARTTGVTMEELRANIEVIAAAVAEMRNELARLEN